MWMEGEYELIPNRTQIENNVVITRRKEIEIEFDYPLGTLTSEGAPVAFKFRSKNGFTMSQFNDAVVLGYLEIFGWYDLDEMDTRGIVKAINLGFDPPKSTYKTWGHTIGDLVLEGFNEVDPGKFTLKIGS
jgi:hypothetical protein